MNDPVLNSDEYAHMQYLSDLQNFTIVFRHSMENDCAIRIENENCVSNAQINELSTHVNTSSYDE